MTCFFLYYREYYRFTGYRGHSFSPGQKSDAAKVTDKSIALGTSYNPPKFYVLCVTF